MAQERNNDLAEEGGGRRDSACLGAVGKRDRGLFSVIPIENMSEEKKENSV
jgi:hypothetical protein